MIQLVGGAITMGYAVTALFFLKYWRRTRDRLFLYFAISMAVLGAQRLALQWFSEKMEDTSLFYAIRLIAFGMILFAIWDKNRSHVKG